jgi:hypothetical protein
MEHPDVGFLVPNAIARAIHDDRLKPIRHDVAAARGNASPVRSSHSSTLATTVLPRGVMRSTRAPSRQCTRSDGSNGAPSARFHRAYRAIDTSG